MATAAKTGRALAMRWFKRVAAALLIAAGTWSAPAYSGVRAATVALWSEQAPRGIQPPARAQFGMAGDKAGNIYVYGGRGPDGAPMNDFWRRNATTQIWQHLDSTGMPELVEPHLAMDAAGNVYEFGGIGTPGGTDFSDDGHSFGLYEYLPVQGRWIDLTSANALPGKNWPLGREDLGFAYDPGSDTLWVFAGEGPGNTSLNDMWRYTPATRSWQRIAQRYVAPGGSRIDAREIYEISYDGRGGFYLFGGAYVVGPDGRRVGKTYANDLWRFEIKTLRWTLLAGQANGYDPAMPLPRHYYGQACDAQGNYYILGGYVSDTENPPYFSSDASSFYAQLVVFENADVPTGNIMYALDDFWQYTRVRHAWVDLSDRLGDSGTQPFIPYMMVAEPASSSLLTFGGYRLGSDGELAVSANVWTYSVAGDATPH